MPTVNNWSGPFLITKMKTIFYLKAFKTNYLVFSAVFLDVNQLAVTGDPHGVYALG